MFSILTLARVVRGKKVILVLCTHKTLCLSVHRFLRVKVHILCVTDKAFNKIIFRCELIQAKVCKRYIGAHFCLERD